METLYDDNEKPSIFKCNRKKIQHGSTSIFIMEARQECINDVRNSIEKKKDEFESSEDDDLLSSSYDDSQCTRNFKRSTEEEESSDDETIVVIKKRGNKIFIEL